ncbi:MAG: radical SAM protein [Crenarchaeota archaeon]|nr:radical SAM protein [Thermoproteota archaeon]
MSKLLRALVKPSILQVESTNDCNLDCRICMRRGLNRRVGYIDIDEFKKLPLESFSEICLHGWGEPLLHPRILDLISIVKKRGRKASLSTNGLLVEKLAEEILHSGLDELTFGIYTLSRKRSIEAMRRLVDMRNRLGVPMTIYLDVTIFSDNVDEVPKLVKVGLEAGVDGVVLHRVFNVYGVDPSVSYISPSAERRLFKEVKKIGGERVYLPTKHTTPCRVTLHTVFVTWDLRQTPCVFLPLEDLGDARVDYATMLSRHLSFVSRMKRHGVCSKCFW